MLPQDELQRLGDDAAGFEAGVAAILARARKQAGPHPTVPTLPTATTSEGQTIGGVGTVGRGRPSKPTDTGDLVDAFEERAVIIEHDGGLPRQEAETQAAQDQGHADAPSFHDKLVGRWAAEIKRLAKLPAVSPDGAEALEQARAFIAEGWALQAVRLGWDEVELFGVCPRAPWTRLDRKGAAFGGAVQIVTAEAVAYVDGLRRYRAQVNNDHGADPIWALPDDTTI